MYNPKRNTLIQTCNIGSIILLFAMYIKIKLFKWKETNLTSWFEIQKNLFLKDIEDKYFSNFFMYTLIILNTAIGFFLLVKINSLEPIEANFYPNDFYVIIYQLIWPLQFIGLVALAYYIEHKMLISILLSEVKEAFGM